MALTDSLVEYWPLNEASGSRAGSHAGLTLTDENTVLSTTGKVYALAADFDSASNERLSRLDEASLSTGNIDFTIACWAQFESKGANRTLAAKADNGGAGNVEWSLIFYNGQDRINFQVNSGAGFLNKTEIKADNFASPPLSTWFFVVGWHDATADTINIQVNDGTANSAPYTFGCYDNAAPFVIGDSGFLEFWNGLIGPVMFWKRVLTASERTTLYNGGNGLTYAQLVAGGAIPSTPFALSTNIRPMGFFGGGF